DEIATEVSNALAVSLMIADGDSPFGSVSTRNVEAYDLYLQALSEYRKASIAALERADQLLQRAVLIEPKFAEAYALLGQVVMWRTSTGALGYEEGLAGALDYAERALVLDPGNVDARVLEITMRSQIATFSGDYGSSEAAMAAIEALVAEAAGEVGPKLVYSGFLQFYRRYEEALTQLDRAIELDPLNPELHYRRGQLLQEPSVGRLSEARQAMMKSLEIEPDQPNVHGALAYVEKQQGELIGLVESLEEAARIDPLDPELPVQIALELSYLGLPELAAPYLERATAIDANNPRVRFTAIVHALVAGERERFFALARNVIADDIDNRRGSFDLTVGLFVRESQRDGTLDEAVEFIVAHHPGFMDPFGTSAPLKVLIARGQSLFTMALGQSAEEQLAAAALMREMATSAGQQLEDWDLSYLEVQVLEGNPDKAIAYMLDTVFPSQPFEAPYDLLWPLLHGPMFEEVIAQPEVAAGLANWQRSLDLAIKRLVDHLERRAAQSDLSTQT
ncbi:MAG: tetratricopeptide repeat protein, partial [Pseudomonadota bacterium]